MKEKILDIVNKYLQDCRDHRSRNFQFMTECSLNAMVSPTYLHLMDRGTSFNIFIYRNTNLIQINGIGIDYRQNFNFIEVFLELEKINNISFSYEPHMGEIIEQEILVYNRDKTIESIL
tara:strand:- start:160 stop:516 length:357 start_codon:yes stop_codon:yes gene_type:complete